MLAAGSRLVPGYTLKSDTIAGRYRVERVYGGGSAGFVVAAQHIHTAQPVALKVLTQRGARANTGRAATLKSPHVARIVETGITDDGCPYIATERLEGQSLAGCVFPARKAVGLILQACAGIAEAHAAGVVHGDLKPQNLLLTTDGVLKILDFGMTMPLCEESEEASAAWFASPAYLAPEQLREPVAGPRADVWALGVILHQLVSGRLPFQADTIAGMFVAVAYDEPATLAEADVSLELAKIVRGCLEKNPKQRPSVEALAEALAPFADARQADSLPPMMIDQADVISTSTAPGLGPVSRMTKAFTKSSSRPPPLPPSRLGAKPRPSKIPHPPRLPSNVGRAAKKGWLAVRLATYRAMAPRTPEEKRQERRRWGVVSVIAAAGALAVASLFAQSTTTVARLEDDATVLGEQTIDAPADLAVLPIVPASFALPARQETPSSVLPAPEATPGAKYTPRPRPRLAVREDPYAPPGFTHPSKLREARSR